MRTGSAADGCHQLSQLSRSSTSTRSTACLVDGQCPRCPPNQLWPAKTGWDRRGRWPGTGVPADGHPPRIASCRLLEGRGALSAGRHEIIRTVTEYPRRGNAFGPVLQVKVAHRQADAREAVAAIGEQGCSPHAVLATTFGHLTPQGSRLERTLRGRPLVICQADLRKLCRKSGQRTNELRWQSVRSS